MFRQSWGDSIQTWDD